MTDPKLNYGLLEAQIDGRHTWTDAQVDVLLGRLTERECFIILNRFSYIPVSLRELGSRTWRLHDKGIGVTPERVRQIEHKTLRKLRGHLRRQIKEVG